MTNQDSSFRQAGGSQDSRSECESTTIPTIDRWVIWNEVNGDWDISDSQSPKKGHKKPIMLPDESGPHQIRFHLKVPGGSGWRFDTVAPIWTADNVQCSTLKGLASDQISVTDPKAHQLTILDKNDGEARLIRYQLNFTANEGEPTPPVCDPAILNGGGGRI